jgi:hypothetical protein
MESKRLGAFFCGARLPLAIRPGREKKRVVKPLIEIKSLFLSPLASKQAARSAEKLEPGEQM